jgi:hypothetical protein
VSTTQQVEYAGGVGLELANRSRAGVIARAPRWWQDLARRSGPAGTRSVAVGGTPRWGGWVCGVACAGVSDPIQAESDRLVIREMMTDAAIQGMAKQAGQGDGVPLRWGHRGRTMATSRGLDLVLRARAFMGLCFSARVPDTREMRQILEAIGDQVVDVSIGFRPRKARVEQRGGERLRIVSDAELVEISLLPPGSGMQAVYPAGRAAAALGHRDLCPASIRTKAEQASYQVLKAQAGIFQ